MLIALGIATWTVGEIYYTQVLWDAEVIPSPPLADIGYLLLCPLWFAGFVADRSPARPRHGRRPSGWTACVAALAVAAVGAAVVFEPVAHAAEGRPLAVATNLAYPIFDLVMLGDDRRRHGRCAAGASTARSRCCSLGVVAFWIADSVYLVQTANGTYTTGGPYDIGWWLGLVLISAAAWQPAPARARRRRESTLRRIVMPARLRARLARPARATLRSAASRRSPSRSRRLAARGHRPPRAHLPRRTSRCCAPAATRR